jgi:hypothetical protein
LLLIFILLCRIVFVSIATGLWNLVVGIQLARRIQIDHFARGVFGIAIGVVTVANNR